jgi:hypothetical protein
MNPTVLFAIALKNGSDIEAIITAMGGISNALKLLPHIYAIAATYQAEMAKPAPNSPGTQSGGAINR